jgi:hypothetical protein
MNDYRFDEILETLRRIESPVTSTAKQFRSCSACAPRDLSGDIMLKVRELRIEFCGP